MPLVTTLLQQPNQNFTSILEQDAYDINIRTINNFTYISIIRNGIQIITNERPVINNNILFYPYQFNNFGNFRFFSNSNDYPFYEQFGVSVYLLYITKSEVESGF